MLDSNFKFLQNTLFKIKILIILNGFGNSNLKITIDEGQNIKQMDKLI